jgi:Endoplasmic Reticulum-Golgi Intermediate Compartment (ERGIC)
MYLSRIPLRQHPFVPLISFMPYVQHKMGLQERLKSFDAHSSVSNEFRVYTTHGAVVSVLTVFIIITLVVSEFNFNFQSNLRENVHVNATTPRGLELEIDMTFWNIGCSKISIDSSDHLNVRPFCCRRLFKLFLLYRFLICSRFIFSIVWMTQICLVYRLFTATPIITLRQTASRVEA